MNPFNNPLMQGVSGAMMPGGGGLSMSTSSATGDQTQNLSFQGGQLNMGGNDKNQLLLIGAVLLVGFLLLKKGK